jgi:hypothetical protein
MNERVNIEDYIATQNYNKKWFRKLVIYPMRLFGVNEKVRYGYAKMLCKFRLYTRFTDGRCQWCGENHLKLENNSSTHTLEENKE